MIEWGPGSTPPPQVTPVDPSPPVAPTPDDMTVPGLAPLAAGAAPTRPGYTLPDASLHMTKEQMEALGPLGQIGRGYDIANSAMNDVADFLFGEKSLLHGPADLLTGAVLAPFEIGADVLNSVSLGGVTGSNTYFDQIGEYAKTQDPDLYTAWLETKAKADSGGAGKEGFHGYRSPDLLRSDFNELATKYIDDTHYDSMLGASPKLALGGRGIGSLGDAMSDAAAAWLGALVGESVKHLGNAGVYDPSSDRQTYDQAQRTMATRRETWSRPPSWEEQTEGFNPDVAYALEQERDGKFTEQQARDYIEKNSGGRDRLTEAAARIDRGDEASDAEVKAVTAWRNGEWSQDHATTWLISAGQGVTRDPLGQIIGTVLSDPLVPLTMGAGGISGLGKAGATLIRASSLGERGFEALSLGQRLGSAGLAGARVGVAGVPVTPFQRAILAVRAVQVDPYLGPIFRGMRALVDPLGVFKPSPKAIWITDLRNGVAINAFGRTYRSGMSEVAAIGREFGMDAEVKSAIASYSIDQADLMIAVSLQERLLAEGFGEGMLSGAISVDSLVPMLSRIAAQDAETQLVDHMTSLAKNTFTAQENAELAGRAAAMFGNDVAYWEKRLPTLSNTARSELHVVTYKYAEKGFMEARGMVNDSLYTGDLPIRNMVLMTSETLDDVVARTVIDGIRASLKSADATNANIAAATARWNEAVMRYPAIAHIGYAPGGKTQLEALVKELEKELEGGGLSRRAMPIELEHPVLKPIRDWVDRNPLWKVGFRPDEEVAWGLKRDFATGRPVVDRAPTISHTVDAVPGRQPFTDTVRNVAGQIIGKRAAEHALNPVVSLTVFAETMKDVVSGRRLTLNISRRFEKSTFDIGMPKPISSEIMRVAREISGLDHSTLRGLKPKNLWTEIADIIPRNLVLKDGTTVNIHIVMDHLLRAAEGDLRVMGVGGKLSQRIRNDLRKLGLDPGNWSGQMTVTMYNTLRYSQPMFLMQRIGDAPYYSMLYGIHPLGFRAALTEAERELEIITGNLGRTQTARDASMDMMEYGARSNFTAGIKSAMQEAGVRDSALERVLSAPDNYIANSMTHMLHARTGDIVQGVLANLAKVAKDADPALQAEMLAAGEQFQRTFADFAQHYSMLAGRPLSDAEVGLQYYKDQLTAWRAHVLNEDYTLDYEGYIAEGQWAMPSSVADVQSIRPGIMARKLGYADETALRRDVNGHIEMVGGVPTLVKGESDLAQLAERIRFALNAHPDVIKRAVAYFGEDWGAFWNRMAKPIDVGGLDLSPHYAKEAQAAIAMIAKERGMDPWEYLSGVMVTNLGAKDMATAIGRLAAFLRGGALSAEDMSKGEWGAFIRSNIDPSGQQSLLDAAGAAAPRTGAAGSIETKMAAASVEMPPFAAGEAPLAPGMIRAYHYTSPDALTAIRKEGLLRSKAKGSTYGEPDTIWFSTTKPAEDRAFVEVHLRPDELADGAPFKRLGEDETQWQKRIDDFNAGGGNFNLQADHVPADRIVTYNEDWMHEYRALVKEATADPVAFRKEFGWALEDKWIDTSTGRAIQKRLAELEGVAGSQADNVAEGVAHGATVESGGAIKASPVDEAKLAFADAESAWKASRANLDAAKTEYETAIAAKGAAKAAVPADEQALLDTAQQTLDDFESKWANASKNHLRMEKDLTKMEADGWETGDAMDALDEYRNVERSEFDPGIDGTEEYQQARDDAWQTVIDKVAEMDPQNVVDNAADAAPAAAVGEAQQAFDTVTYQDKKLDYEAGWNASKRSTTYDLDAAEARYTAKHPDKANMFAAGWQDHAAEKAKYSALGPETKAAAAAARPEQEAAALWDQITNSVPKYPSIKPGETKPVNSKLLVDADVDWFVRKYAPFVKKTKMEDGYQQYEMTLPAERPGAAAAPVEAAPAGPTPAEIEAKYQAAKDAHTASDLAFKQAKDALEAAKAAAAPTPAAAPAAPPTHYAIPNEDGTFSVGWNEGKKLHTLKDAGGNTRSWATQEQALAAAAKDASVPAAAAPTPAAAAPTPAAPLTPGPGLTDDEFYAAVEKVLKERADSGVPHPNADVEGIIQSIVKLLKVTMKGAPAGEGSTRSILRSLVEDLPTNHAVPYNRTHALVVMLLKDKILEAQKDIFRLAEMQTQRTVLERSLNHPLFGVYPASYMWGKVLPETLKFFARNPYAATFIIADVQRSIAIQREFNPDMEATMNAVDRSSAAFLLDYLTPGLVWNPHEARMSPMVRALLKGRLQDIIPNELATVSPERWYRAITDTFTEFAGYISGAVAPTQGGALGELPSAIGGAGGAPAPTPTGTGTITGPVRAAGLAAVLADDLGRLQSILLGGQDAAQ